MNPILQAAIGSILRHVLTAGAAYLVTRGIWTPEEATTYAAAAALALLGLGWAVWQKAQMHQKIEQALDLPAGSTLDDLNAATH